MYNQMDINIFELKKDIKARVELSLNKQLVKTKSAYIESTFIEIPSGILFTINKDDNNKLDIKKSNSCNSYQDIDLQDTKNNYIYQNPFNKNYFLARIVGFNFDSSNIFAEQKYKNFENYYQFFNTLKKINSSNQTFGEIYVTLDITNCVKI